MRKYVLSTTNEQEFLFQREVRKGIFTFQSGEGRKPYQLVTDFFLVQQNFYKTILS